VSKVRKSIVDELDALCVDINFHIPDAGAAGVELAHADPVLVRILPDVDGATEAIALVPLPTKTLFAV